MKMTDNSFVIVPGILGSSLDYQNQWRSKEIWTDKLLDNYRILRADPLALKWNGVTANATLIEHFDTPFSRWDIWDNFTGFVKLACSAPDDKLIRFGYDWRASLRNTSTLLKARLDVHVNCDVSAPQTGDTKFTFFCHSMGGLLLLCLVGQGKIHPSWIEKVFFIGCPLKGVPIAFQYLFAPLIAVPYLERISPFLLGRNKQTFLRSMQMSLASFASCYELLPVSNWKYLVYSYDDRRNPLEEQIIDQTLRDNAIETHRVVDAGRDFLRNNNVRCYALLTYQMTSKQTPIEFAVNHHTSGGYAVQSVFGLTSYGDGTVPQISAFQPGCELTDLLVYDVEHMFLCSNSLTLSRLLTVL